MSLCVCAHAHDVGSDCISMRLYCNATQRSLSRESLRGDNAGEDRGRVRSQSPSGSGGGSPKRGLSLHAALQAARRELVLRDQDLARAKESAVTERRGRKQQVAAAELRLQEVTDELVRVPHLRLDGRSSTLLLLLVPSLLPLLLQHADGRSMVFADICTGADEAATAAHEDSLGASGSRS